jgi:hypothetical protein
MGKFSEALHPRGKGGKFAKKGSGGTAAKVAKKVADPLGGFEAGKRIGASHLERKAGRAKKRFAKNEKSFKNFADEWGIANDPKVKARRAKDVKKAKTKIANLDARAKTARAAAPRKKAKK